MVHYLPSLALTIAVELVLALLVCARSHRSRERLHLAVAVVLLNGFTHPFAFLVAGQVEEFDGGTFWTIEATVFLVEALGLRGVMGMEWSRALGVSLVCNAVTAGLSFLV